MAGGVGCDGLWVNKMKYNEKFFDYVDSGSIRSAEVVANYLFPLIRPRSILDVGCGRGGWLRAWKAAGCGAIAGVDGDYVDRTSMYIADDEFHPVDLSRAFSLGRRFDMVQCLEVAEHIPSGSSDLLIESLVCHSDIVLFSAAQPGQGGTQHINERPLEFWRGVFAAGGFRPYDCVRPALYTDQRIEPWYRFNSIVYANDAGAERLPESVRATLVPNDTALSNFASLSWRMRLALFRGLPVSAIDQIARVNAEVRRLSSTWR